MKSLLQTEIWANFKSRHGWTPHRVLGQLFLERSLPLGQRFLYAPELPFHRPSGLKTLIDIARRLGQERSAFVVRLEFFSEWSEQKAALLSALGLRQSFEEVQPEWRQWIDLTPSEDQILAAMKPKGRYNIRLAEKHGVTVEPETNPEIFWQLFLETARRNGFSIRNKTYYADLIDTLHKHAVGELLVASSPVALRQSLRQPLAAAIISWHAGIATYLYGASSSKNRALMAPYLLHWTAMVRAKQQKCKIYDLLAVAPVMVEGQRLPAYWLQLKTKYAGIARFKSQFGGRTVHLLGSWDLVLRPAIYTAFRLIEQHRRS